MNELECKILNIIQHDFPLEVHPFRVIAQKADVSEQVCLDVLRKLHSEGILRGIKPVVQWRKLGFSSVLVGAEVNEEKIDIVAERINFHPGVTHNYKRSGPLNLWFTLTYENETERKLFISEIESFEGVIRIREFPSDKMYKIGLVLDV
jgi:DNA-binding Lrp family transcriptional regulator